MKVLMFGWEFPPHISGGLGTACFGLTRGLSSIHNLEVIFVVPKMYGDETNGTVKLIGANRIPITSRNVKVKGFLKEMNLLEVGVTLIPYLSPEQYEKEMSINYAGLQQKIKTDEKGLLEFSGGY